MQSCASTNYCGAIKLVAVLWADGVGVNADRSHAGLQRATPAPLGEKTTVGMVLEMGQRKGDGGRPYRITARATQAGNRRVVMKTIA